MFYESRVYEIVPGRAPDLHARFAEITGKFFAKHGIRVVFYAEPVFGTTNELHYLVAWESLAEREQKWGAFASDPGWLAAKAETEKDGQIVARIRNQFLKATPYSPTP